MRIGGTWNLASKDVQSVTCSQELGNGDRKLGLAKAALTDSVRTVTTAFKEIVSHTVVARYQISRRRCTQKTTIPSMVVDMQSPILGQLTGDHHKPRYQQRHQAVTRKNLTGTVDVSSAGISIISSLASNSNEVKRIKCSEKVYKCCE
ncbi:hypothetical protein COOONC_13357 [Cooperia oncophora]